MTEPRPPILGTTILGWREWAALPDLGVEHLKAKVDTGARTSALHAPVDIEVDDDAIRFVIHPFQDDDATVVPVAVPLVGHREVRSSNGEVELRPVIRTRLHIGEKVTEIDLTLTRRDQMGFRLLLGREALRAGAYVVDPAVSFTAGGTRLTPP